MFTRFATVGRSTPEAPMPPAPASQDALPAAATHGALPLATIGAAGYRDALPVLADRLDRLVRAEATREAELSAVLRVRTARLARSIGGVAGIVGVIGAALAGAIGPKGALTVAMLLAGVLALVTWAVARVFLDRRTARGRDLGGVFGLTGDVHRDLARFRDGMPRLELAAAVERLEVRSVALPLIALALLAPLTLHWLVWLGLRSSWDPVFGGFDAWIKISAVIVGHCHLLLAGLSLRFARRLRSQMVPSRTAGWWTWLWVLLASLVPGVVLLAVPVLLVTLTGLAFIPLSFWSMARTVERERAAIDLWLDPAAPVAA